MDRIRCWSCKGSGWVRGWADWMPQERCGSCDGRGCLDKATQLTRVKKLREEADTLEKLVLEAQEQTPK